MKPHISGSKPPAERKMAFCIGAKVCSKGMSVEEARKICSQPKPPKEHKEGKGRRAARRVVPCEMEVGELVACMSGIVQYPLPENRNQLNENLYNALMECKCQQKTK
jgi:hypothetical protein